MEKKKINKTVNRKHAYVQLNLFQLSSGCSMSLNEITQFLRKTKIASARTCPYTKSYGSRTLQILETETRFGRDCGAVVKDRQNEWMNSKHKRE